jgi:hypothetical protein
MNLVELLRDRGIDSRQQGQHHHARKGWVQFDCPFCGQGTSKYHLGFNPRGGYFNCFKCGPHDAVKTVSEMLSCPWSEAKSLVESADTGFLKAPQRADKPARRRSLVLPYGLGPLNPGHRLYLEMRGFDPDEIQDTWRVQGLGVAPPLSHRLFIPIFDRAGQMVSWTTRSIAKHATLRYVSAKANQELFSHKEILYGEHKVVGYSTICVVEGPISMWAIGTGCVATCGIGFKREQALLLARYQTVYVCFDNEPSAQRRAKELCDFLMPNCEVINVVLTDKDPADALLNHPKEIKQLRRLLK